MKKQSNPSPTFDKPEPPPVPPKKNEEICTWTLDTEHGFYSTSCADDWWFSVVGMKFCPMCGKKLILK